MISRLLRRLWCKLGQHSGYVDGGFHCQYCPFEIPYEHDDTLIDRALASRRNIQLGEDVKAIYPEEWQQDAILRAWHTGQPAVGKRP
jgi:hypothetical protein